MGSTWSCWVYPSTWSGTANWGAGFVVSTLLNGEDKERYSFDIEGGSEWSVNHSKYGYSDGSTNFLFFFGDLSCFFSVDLSLVGLFLSLEWCLEWCGELEQDFGLYLWLFFFFGLFFVALEIDDFKNLDSCGKCNNRIWQLTKHSNNTRNIWIIVSDNNLNWRGSRWLVRYLDLGIWIGRVTKSIGQ